MAGMTATAILAGTFIGSLGINTHIDFIGYGNNNPAVVAAAIKYLGVHNVRDSPQNPSDLQTWPQIAQTAGVKFDAYLPEGSPAAMQNTYTLIPQLAASGILNFVEGGNEEDNDYAIQLGNSIAYAAGFQPYLYQLGHSLNLPVINMSFGSGWTAANNWHGNYDKVGDLSPYADYANAHIYPASAAGQPNSTIQLLNFDASLAAVGRPVIATELGWDAATASDQAVAKYVLSGILDCAKSGNPYTYIYALFDDQAGKFGMMNVDGTPRPAGAALHNLTALLADPTTPPFNATGSLKFDIAGTGGAESTLLLQKSDGAYWLAIWDEMDTDHAISLTLDAKASQLQLFDPLIGTNPLQTVNNTTAVSFTLGDHPLLVRVMPALALAAASSTTPANVLTSYTNNAVLTGNAGTTAIYAYGTGSTLTGGSGVYTIQAFSGGNTIYGGTGVATIRVAGAGNKIYLGSGTNTLSDSGTGSVITFNGIGAGVTDIYGYILEQGATLNMKPLLAGSQWTGDTATLGNFLKVAIVNANTTISIVPSGLAGGASMPVATLHGYGYLTLATLMPRLAF
jgi:hypothetical protein